MVSLNRQSSSADLFVVGGGPAGLAAAIAARREGLRVTVADCARPPIDKACGEGLLPDGVAALSKLGVAIDGRAESYPLRGIRFIGSDASVEAGFPAGGALGIRRTELHRALVERASEVGVSMRWGAQVDGISAAGVTVDGATVSCGWIAGADGGQSVVRRWAGLEHFTRDSVRFGFRRHYRVAPWTDYLEIYWGAGCQIYVTPVRRDELCVVALTPDQHLRLDQALGQFPELLARLPGTAVTTAERGAVTAWRRLKSVYRGRVVLIGDASGSVDAVTGDGLSLAFQQALALAGALAAGDLERYQAEHRRIARRPGFMSALLLSLANRAGLRRRALRALASQPRLFDRMLAMHVGALSPVDCALSGIALGWQLLRA